MAEEWGKPVIKVQHHVAHIYSVLSEHGLSPDEPFLGIAFDGVGYGEDSAVWGGEFFLNDGERLARTLHLRYVPQPGGDLAAKEPWRMALSYLLDSFGDVPRVGILKDVDEKKITAVEIIKILQIIVRQNKLEDYLPFLQQTFRNEVLKAEKKQKLKH